MGFRLLVQQESLSAGFFDLLHAVVAARVPLLDHMACVLLHNGVNLDLCDCKALLSPASQPGSSSQQRSCATDAAKSA